MAQTKSRNPNEPTPFDNVFIVAGFIVGYIYAMRLLGGEFWPSAIVGVICAGLGFAVGKLVYRLIIIALVIIMILARQALFGAVIDAATA